MLRHDLRMSIQVDVVEAARILDDLYERAIRGGDVVITVGGRPRVRLQRIDETGEDRGTG
jgi:antitoxin (DNA-binding transcriptional repressor) of toxin-antitoxin stability system